MPDNHSAVLVEVTRAMDEPPWQGFVVAESKSLVVLHRVSDRFDLDGYCAFRRDDIVSIAESIEKRDLIQRALRLNRQDPMVPEKIDTGSMPSLMVSVQAAFGSSNGNRLNPMRYRLVL